jgi:leader peptidase (prepilin peptidase)/N-methyltransferase
MPVPFFEAFAFLFGLCIGSFLNVVAWRAPRGESIVSPPSACPCCGGRIAWFDNVPVLSWLLLGASCRACGCRISFRYPLGELATGLLFLGAALSDGFSLQFLSDAVFLSLLILTVQTDLVHWIVLDEVSLGGAAAGVALSLFRSGLSPLESAGAAAGGFLFFLMIRLMSLLVLRLRPGYVLPPEGHEGEGEEFTGGMGWGDVKLAACMGAFLGPGPTVVAFFVAFLTGAITGVLVTLAGRRSRRVPIPFGPFMALGGAVAVFAGAGIWEAYLSMTGLGL